MFCKALEPLLAPSPDAAQQLVKILDGFVPVMQQAMETMWASKLGLDRFDHELTQELVTLMMQTPVDYTIFFRELSSIPDSIDQLEKSFYQKPDREKQKLWTDWLARWKSLLAQSQSLEYVSSRMKSVNPKYSLREWLLAPAYKQAARGDYTLIRELQQVMTEPYAEQSKAIEEKFYQLKPSEFSDIGGVSHMSCSS
jgi:uncharacterized protein YdiU (UPF0061 family)